MKILLLTPPHWGPAMPHLATPTLTAYLRAQGTTVVQRDLNIETFKLLLTPRAVEEALDRLRTAPPPGIPRAVINRALELGPRLAGQVLPATHVLRGERFFDGPASRHAVLTLAEVLQVVSLPYHPTRFSWTDFRAPAPVDSSRALIQLARDDRRNLFYHLFREQILPSIRAMAPDLVGISIPSMGQFLAGVTLASLIREARVAGHVTVGGGHITMIRESLARAPKMFDLFDSAVLFAGEIPLARLAEALDAGEDLQRVPNLMYRIGDEVHANPVEMPPPPMLPPDFSDLLLEDSYLSPHRVLPLLSSYGCYHGRCAFCNVGYGAPKSFVALDADLVVDQMLALRDTYGARHFFFADEAMTPRTLRVLATRLADADLHWCGCVRFEHGLTAKLLHAMARAGCRMLLFGLESAAPRILARMHKGIHRTEISRVLRDSAAAGIWNHVFFFFGFPGEKLTEAQETVDFIYAHQDSVHSASPGAFLLERYAPVERQPADYGVTRVGVPSGRDLPIYFDYEVRAGLSEAQANMMAERLIDVLPEHEFGQYYLSDAYRLLYASHLAEHGLSMPRLLT